MKYRIRYTLLNVDSDYPGRTGFANFANEELAMKWVRFIEDQIPVGRIAFQVVPITELKICCC